MEGRILIPYSDQDFPIDPHDRSHAATVAVNRYWNGESAPPGRHCEVRLMWSAMALYVRFDAAQEEPLVVSDTPQIGKKTIGLWDRDVCEIFIAPDASTPNRYFEFEVAPNGEWIDLAIDLSAGTRITDFEYASGMSAAARTEKNKIVATIKIPWTALGNTPRSGDIWRGNLFRCIGKDPNRGYLAWQPTMTEEPSFHVPEKFGEFEFV